VKPYRVVRVKPGCTYKSMADEALDAGVD
jgi:hypothetical protein